MTKGAAGHFDVQCKHSPQPETWRLCVVLFNLHFPILADVAYSHAHSFFDQAGGTNTLRGGGSNSGVGSAFFSGMSPVKKGGQQQAKGAGIDIFISCH